MRVTIGLAMAGWLVSQPALETLEAQSVAEEPAATQDPSALMEDSLAVARDSLVVAQDSLPVVRDPLAVAVPFGPGERMEYQVKLGIFSAGEAYIAVEGLDTVRGHPTYRLAMGLEGGILFAKVNDTYQSWLDTRRLVSLRFVRDVHEVRYKAFREWMIFPEEKRWELISADRAETMNTSEPLDELAFVFWLRTLPLEVGDTYTSDRYFLDDGNPVVIRVLRKGAQGGSGWRVRHDRGTADFPDERVVRPRGQGRDLPDRRPVSPHRLPALRDPRRGLGHAAPPKRAAGHPAQSPVLSKLTRRETPSP